MKRGDCAGRIPKGWQERQRYSEKGRENGAPWPGERVCGECPAGEGTGHSRGRLFIMSFVVAGFGLGLVLVGLGVFCRLLLL
jgi:hypothetical protein